LANPRFSILTLVREAPFDALQRTLGSIEAQTFDDWELVLVDDVSAQPRVGELLERAAAGDRRMRYRRREGEAGIVASANYALEMARGEFVAMAEPGDELHPSALAEVHEALLATPEADYLYTDEDTVNARGRRTIDFFKPDWSPDRMRSQMYTGHLSVLRRTAVEQAGGFDTDCEGAHEWDLVLKVTERARAVLQVPRVLYHRHAPPGGDQRADLQTSAAEVRAVQAHCNRIGLPARVEGDPSNPGICRLEPKLADQPSVSIVIPTRGQAREIRHQREVLVCHCVRSIVERSTYENFDIVVVADGDTAADVIDGLAEIAGERLRLVEYDGPFNFSAKINLGARRSEGEHLLLLNDDMEVITQDWIERMVMYSSLPEIGAVGGKLLWEDGRLQHVGVSFERGLPGHPYRGFPPDSPGYANSVGVVRDCLAVTGACMMSRREAFDQVGGFDTAFPLNYNDVDFCLQQRAAGRRVVYDPDLVLYHFESSSRSSQVDAWEKELLKERWLPITAVDPYSNPNLRGRAKRLRSALRQLGDAVFRGSGLRT
jgi:GT2 family glycosyltransferase